MKKLTTIILSLILLSALFVAAGCQKGALVAEYKEEIEDAYCFYKEEFDIEPYIKKQTGVEYTVYAEQLDSETFDPVILEVNGFKFTPVLYEEVLVYFTAEKDGEKVTSKEIKLFVEIRVDKVVELFNQSWCDQGMSKEVNIDENYIRSERVTSTKVSWFGREPKEKKDRFQYFATLIGDEISDYYSVTDWTDAVLTFWVYNPTDYEIEFSPMWSHDQAKINLINDPKTSRFAAPNSWTEIKYSLRYYGMTENFYYDDELYFSYAGIQVSYGIGFDHDINRKKINQNWWTCRWGGRKADGTSYDYSFYIDGFDIRNYDPIKDADLDHEYRGFWNEPLEPGDETSIAVVDNDGKTFSFEYKMIEDEGTFGIALIEKYWASDYMGYFTFDKDGEIDDYEGVTATLQDNGYIRVDFDLNAVNLIEGDKKPEKVETLYVRSDYNEAHFIIRLAEDPEITE